MKTHQIPRMIEIYGRYGIVGRFATNDPDLPQRIHRVIRELGDEEDVRPDLEHESISISNADGWTIEARVSGLIAFGNAEEPTNLVYQRDMTMQQLESVFLSLAKGDMVSIKTLGWVSRNHLPPFRRNWYLYANHPLKTDLHKASHLGDVAWVKELVDQRVELNARDEYRATPLHCAALAGNCSVCSELLRSGANVNLLDADGKTSLDYATDYPEIQRLIEQFGGKPGAEITA